MAKSEYITARIEPSLKQEAEAILAALGLSTTTAVTLFLRQVALHKGLPFAVQLPNAETRAAIAAARQGGEATLYETVDDLMTDLWRKPAG